ncbi:MAG: hypothetical protein AB1531_02130 [Chloroflexota bacterium]
MSFSLLIIAAVLWAGLVYFFFRYRIWFFYYLTGAVGLALLIIGFGRFLLPFELWLKETSAYLTHYLAIWFGIQTRIFTEAPGAILVMVIPQGQGWTFLEIGIECSGLLEQAVLIGLVLFYPGIGALARIRGLLFGILATYIGNIVRILFIVIALAYMGKASLFISHTIIGRIIFFLFVVAIFWIIITRPTLDRIRKNLTASRAS